MCDTLVGPELPGSPPETLLLLEAQPRFFKDLCQLPSKNGWFVGILYSLADCNWASHDAGAQVNLYETNQLHGVPPRGRNAQGLQALLPQATLLHHGF